MLDHIDALAKSYAGSHYRYFAEGGCGATMINLRLNDKKFYLLIYSRWMGDKKPTDIKLSGKIIKTNNPNVIMLCRKETVLLHLIIFDKPIEFDLKYHFMWQFHYLNLYMSDITETNAILLQVDGLSQLKQQIIYLKLI